jgi:triphosphoribosyl-dephospho-CoA synthase
MAVPRVSQLSTGQLATLACLLEATAAKPGNVHPSAAFAEMTYLDFALSAVAIAPAMEAAASAPLGQTVLAAVSATRQLVGKNTNLGTVLLIAPLASVRRGEPLRRGVGCVLANLGADDARQVYEAIRLAQPGGLGSAATADVHGEPPADLVAAMRLAAERDMVARQYAEGFADVFDFVAPCLQRSRQAARPVLDAIVHAQLETMSRFPDSLIARKCGAAVARESAKRAAAVLASGRAAEAPYRAALADFDGWLRADGHSRNPGTTADLIAAGLFAALREGMIDVGDEPSC